MHLWWGSYFIDEWVLQVSTQGQENSRNITFPYLVRMISDSTYHKNIYQNCPQYVLATRHFWHQQCLLSWAWKLKQALGLILSSTLHTQNGNMNRACKCCDREHIQCKKGKIQTSEHTINWSRKLQKPAQQTRMTYTCWEGPCRHCITTDLLVWG